MKFARIKLSVFPVLIGVWVYHGFKVFVLSDISYLRDGLTITFWMLFFGLFSSNFEWWSKN